MKIEANEEVYEDAGENCATSSPRMTPPTPHVPPHSLAAFGLFLRLPNYSEVLLRDRKRAQCLLRLALGVTDDGEGADILSSPFATALPTLPFLVLKQLLDDMPSNTDDGLLLRRTMIEIGAVNLLLDCLAIFTHQSEKDFPVNPMNVGEPKSGPSRAHENKQYYWAKGTGYGTGSTQQAWNVEQSLLRQRWEEEHVTVRIHLYFYVEIRHFGNYFFKLITFYFDFLDPAPCICKLHRRNQGRRTTKRTTVLVPGPTGEFVFVTSGILAPSKRLCDGHGKAHPSLQSDP